jgi:hypothetical protein
MIAEIKIMIQSGSASPSYEGYGKQGRRYIVMKCDSGFVASLISGIGQPIAAMGSSPFEALQRAESVHDSELVF